MKADGNEVVRILSDPGADPVHYYRLTNIRFDWSHRSTVTLAVWQRFATSPSRDWDFSFQRFIGV